VAKGLSMQLVCPNCQFSIAVQEYRARERPCPRCLQNGGYSLLSRFHTLEPVSAHPAAPAPRRAASA
jgi:hypothetical protein